MKVLPFLIVQKTVSLGTIADRGTISADNNSIFSLKGTIYNVYFCNAFIYAMLSDKETAVNYIE